MKLFGRKKSKPQLTEDEKAQLKLLLDIANNLLYSNCFQAIEQEISLIDEEIAETHNMNNYIVYRFPEAVAEGERERLTKRKRKNKKNIQNNRSISISSSSIWDKYCFKCIWH